ncbi:hypothetical protein CN285_20700 [Bacillus cereus]|nr:hypothetical protein CN285_20700 [Bacillus cereus]
MTKYERESVLNRKCYKSISNEIITKSTSKGVINYLVLQKCIFKPFEVLNSLGLTVLKKVYLLKGGVYISTSLRSFDNVFSSKIKLRVEFQIRT